MKKLLLLLLFIPLVSFGQDNNTTVKIKSETNNAYVQAANLKAEGEGIFYKGKGIYTIQQTGKTDMSSYKRQVKKALEKIKSYSKGLNLNYELINTERKDVPVGMGVSRTIITFKLLNNDGTVAVNKLDTQRDKDEAKKELLSLKEYLDLGIITKEEFDKKAVSLKKILLGN
tara:strand:- start:93 stop:608 length:516 start_codon:yes stop_codon:yes gene_type:complete